MAASPLERVPLFPHSWSKRSWCKLSQSLFTHFPIHQKPLRRGLILPAVDPSPSIRFVKPSFLKYNNKKIAVCWDLVHKRKTFSCDMLWRGFPYSKNFISFDFSLLPIFFYWKNGLQEIERYRLIPPRGSCQERVSYGCSRRSLKNFCF